MNSSNLFNTIQLITGVALLIGLVLVFIELRQAKELSLAELTSEGYSEAMSEFRSLMGENPAPVVAKACFEPEKVTPDEQVVLASYYSLKMAHIERIRVLELVAEFGVPWPILARQQLAGVLNTELGRIWFERNFSFDAELYEIGQSLLEDMVDCKDVYLGEEAELARSLIERPENSADARSDS